MFEIKKHLKNWDTPYILPEKIKIEKIEKLIANLFDKTGYFIYVKSLKQTLNHVLVWKKVYRVNKFNQKSWLKPYIDMNTEQ